jgi:hypothetical protein
MWNRPRTENILTYTGQNTPTPLIVLHPTPPCSPRIQQYKIKSEWVTPPPPPPDQLLSPKLQSFKVTKFPSYKVPNDNIPKVQNAQGVQSSQSIEFPTAKFPS